MFNIGFKNACTLVPTVFRWHGKREFKCHFHFSFSHDIEKQIWILLFVFHFRPNFEKRFCTSYFVFRFRITLKNGYQFQFSFFVFAARSDKNVCKITTRRENGNVYHRVTALLIPRSGRQRPGFQMTGVLIHFSNSCENDKRNSNLFFNNK